MDNYYHVFSYEKNVMLNVLYDTLESIGFKIEHANSERGTIMAVSSGPTRRSMRIALNNYHLERKSIIKIFPEIEDEIGEQLSKLLMEEIISTIQRSIS